ncbi:hypothetical protein BPAE_0044g00210 [Botrytis paeoniae]|uniref:Uncharacterized protein n=1 Tax=Botrytis paeoniae TaxID=278948 RepID=A0A4Z1FRE2_9HELO|nr:hypothetical protein BPAE_0044g00210 [Botrytis paeoniae]
MRRIASDPKPEVDRRGDERRDRAKSTARRHKNPKLRDIREADQYERYVPRTVLRAAPPKAGPSSHRRTAHNDPEYEYDDPIYGKYRR